MASAATARVSVQVPASRREEEGTDGTIGDPGLRDRVADDLEVQQAALAYAVEGAISWYKTGQSMPSMPKSVRRDTESWRAESDLVFRYWRECLTADPDAHVMAGELTGHFNAWLKENGHQGWSSKTLAARFGDHDLTKQAKVEKPKPIRPHPDSHEHPEWSSGMEASARP